MRGHLTTKGGPGQGERPGPQRDCNVGEERLTASASDRHGRSLLAPAQRLDVLEHRHLCHFEPHHLWTLCVRGPSAAGRHWPAMRRALAVADPVPQE